MIRFTYENGETKDFKVGHKIYGARIGNMRPREVDWSMVNWEDAEKISPYHLKDWFYKSLQTALHHTAKCDLPIELSDLITRKSHG